MYNRQCIKNAYTCLGATSRSNAGH